MISVFQKIIIIRVKCRNKKIITIKIIIDDQNGYVLITIMSRSVKNKKNILLRQQIVARMRLNHTWASLVVSTIDAYIQYNRIRPSLFQTFPKCNNTGHNRYRT